MCHWWWEKSESQVSCFISFLLITLLDLGVISQATSGFSPWPGQKEKWVLIFFLFQLPCREIFCFLMKRRTHSGGLSFFLWLALVLDSYSFSSCVLMVVLRTSSSCFLQHCSTLWEEYEWMTYILLVYFYCWHLAVSKSYLLKAAVWAWDYSLVSVYKKIIVSLFTTSLCPPTFFLPLWSLWREG